MNVSSKPLPSSWKKSRQLSRISRIIRGLVKTWKLAKYVEQWTNLITVDYTNWLITYGCEQIFQQAEKEALFLECQKNGFKTLFQLDGNPTTAFCEESFWQNSLQPTERCNREHIREEKVGFVPLLKSAKKGGQPCYSSLSPLGRQLSQCIDHQCGKNMELEKKRFWL